MSARRFGVLLALSAISNGACTASDTSDGGAASGGAGGSGASASGATGAGAPATPSTEPVGSFTVLLDAKQSVTTVSGTVRDGPLIEPVFLPAEKLDDCQLFLAKPPFCDPACPPSDVCAVGDVCKPRPVNRSVGLVTLRGLATTNGSDEFTMDPVGTSKGYSPSASVSLKYPPNEPGAEVRLSAAGGDYAPFEIVTTGIAPIEGFSDEPLPLEHDTPLILEWTGQPDTEIEVVLEIAHHGGARGKIICWAEDTGALVIPAALVGALIDLGVAGFPDVSLTRKSVGSTTIAPGRVDLIVFAKVNREVTIAGLTSCLTDEDCPDDQACAQNKACQ